MKPSEENVQGRKPKPAWLRKRIAGGADFEAVRKLVQKSGLHTVCQEARCPNIWECYSQRTATFLILGERCTRNCAFCAVTHGTPEMVDPEEPLRVARAVDCMGLDYAVVTSVTRDDLEDGGSSHFARTIGKLRQQRKGIQIEVLIPDFLGDPGAIGTVVKACPDVLNHNLETVRRLYPAVRPQADYERSLSVFRIAGQTDAAMVLKSGIMLGLGEKSSEIEEALQDLYSAGCRILTLGQYLQPTAANAPVSRYLTPGEFDRWREKALSIGFEQVASGPFVRSSYQARQVFSRLRNDHHQQTIERDRR